jgi:hypothetical protein
MKPRPLLQIGLCAGGSLASLLVLAIILAPNGTLASPLEALKSAPPARFAQAISEWRASVEDRRKADKKATQKKRTAAVIRREWTMKRSTQASLIQSTTVDAPILTTTTAAPALRLLSIVDRPDIRENHRILADKVLRHLPSLCRDNLRNFYVLYVGAERRGLGGKTTIILDGTVPDSEFVQLLAHECGHVIHANMPGTASSGLSSFRDGQEPFYLDAPLVGFFIVNWQNESAMRAGVTAEDFASGYGRENAFENFSETFAAYVFHRDWLKTRAAGNVRLATQLDWLETNLPMTAYPATSGAVWNGQVPWDVTKLPLAL